jgi:hypothetical protein
MDYRVIRKNIVWKDKYKGQRCFILGNAPTINDIDISVLENEHTFVMSTFYNHPDYDKLKKKIHTSVQLALKNEDEKIEWMRKMDLHTRTTNDFFFALEEKKLIEKNHLFPDKNIFYIASAEKKRSFDITKITKSYITNIIQVFEIAMYMGFKDIYLHSVNVNAICGSGKYEYFFDRKALPVKDPGVRDDSMVKDLFLEMSAANDVFQELKDIYEYAKKNKIKIYYTNKESLLKFFEYKPFDKVIVDIL